MRSALLKTDYEVICMLTRKTDYLEITQSYYLRLLGPSHSGQMMRCPHCHCYCHPPQVVSNGPLPGHTPRAGPPHGPPLLPGTMNINMLILIPSRSHIWTSWYVITAPEIRNCVQTIHNCFSSPACDSLLVQIRLHSIFSSDFLLCQWAGSMQTLCKLKL